MSSSQRFFTLLFVLISAAITPTLAIANAAPAFTETRVEFEADSVTLGASYFRPKGAVGDLPAIVTAHGSAPTAREGVAFYTVRALEMGFAVLSFDKRGTGESTGAYEAFSVEESDRIFNDLAMDVVWAVRWIAKQDGIDASRIGLFGGSQAGWIMPLAAAQEPLVKFIIIGEGVPLTAGEEAVHEGYLSPYLGEAEHYQDLPIAEADAAVSNYDGAPGYDPAPVLAELNIPMLWVFGLRDWVIPVHPSLDRLEALIRSGKTNHDIHILPFGDHNFTNRATGERYDLKKAVEPWLRHRGFLN